jgi:hypothetical protein
VRESVLTLLVITLPSPDDRDTPANFAIWESESGFMLAKNQNSTGWSSIARRATWISSNGMV